MHREASEQHIMAGGGARSPAGTRGSPRQGGSPGEGNTTAAQFRAMHEQIVQQSKPAGSGMHAYHVLCVLTCVRVSAGARRRVNTMSRLSRACCLLCLCGAYCCGCCDASSGDACACCSTDGDCDVAPARSGQASEPPSPSSSAKRHQNEETRTKRKGG